MKKFTTQLKTEEVEIDGNIYVVSELTGKQRDQHDDFIRSRMVPTGELDKRGNEKMRISSVSGFNDKLVSLGVTKKGGKDPLTESAISSWPASVRGDLADMVRNLSGLSDEEEEKSKKG